jgi:hypothetical protein
MADQRAGTYVYGVVGVIIKVTEGGAAKIVTEASILCHGL